MEARKTITAATTTTTKPTPVIIEYNPDSDQHRSFLKNEIREFNEKLNALAEANKRARNLGLGTVACMLLTGGVGGVVGVGIMGYLANEYGLPMYWPKREEIAADYAKKLERLTSLYVLCCRKGAAVTADETFLELMETLSPYLHRSTLFPVQMHTIEENKHLSEKFRKIMLDKHDVFIPVFKELKPVVVETAVEKPAVPVKADQKNEINKPAEQSYFWSFFSSPTATDKDKKAVPQATQAVAPASQSQGAEAKALAQNPVSTVVKPNMQANNSVAEKQSVHSQIIPMTKEVVSLFNKVKAGTVRMMYGFATPKAEEEVVKRLKV